MKTALAIALVFAMLGAAAVERFALRNTASAVLCVIQACLIAAAIAAGAI